jgi:hypothetical protein
MNTKDLAIISSVALATATLTVAAFLPNSLDAGDDNAPKQILQPKLVSHGIEFTLEAAEHQAFKTGDEPAFNLKAVNTTNKEAQTSVLVTMTSMSPSSKFSRMLALPETLWQKSCPVILKPDETMVIPLTTATKLPPDRMIDVRLQLENPRAASTNETVVARKFAFVTDPSAIVVMNFSTVTPAKGINSKDNQP